MNGGGFDNLDGRGPSTTGPRLDRMISGGMVLNNGGTRYRVSILPFEETYCLWNATAELLHVGFSAAQFGLLGSPRLFQSCAAAEISPLTVRRELDGLLATYPMRVKLTSVDEAELRCGRLAVALFGAADGEIADVKWMRPDLARSLAGDVASGCFVLFVASSSADQHLQGAKLLLRHGTRDLQTHEFSVCSDDGSEG
jgi:hypothetical protein